MSARPYQRSLELRKHRDAQVAVVRDVVPLHDHRGAPTQHHIVAPQVENESKT
jgi:hypothetical protein